MSPATHYQSSKGPKAIADLPFPYLANALAKLRREGDPTRAAEIEAMAARVAELDAERAAKGDEPPDPEPPAAIAAPGHNNPPADSPFEAIKTHVDDLYAEAKGWLDGEPIATQGQADAVSKLLGMIKEAERAADDARKLENEPFDKGKAEVQARYAPLISDTKSVRGKTVLAAEACRKALTPWLQKLDAEREAAAKKAREEAEVKAQAARDEAAKLAAGAPNLEAAERVEEMFGDAKAAIREADKLAAGRARVGDGAYRDTLLKDHWTPSLTDGTAALRHYWATRRPELEAFALRLAVEDVRAGKREIPGFAVTNERRAA